MVTKESLVTTKDKSREVQQKLLRLNNSGYKTKTLFEWIPQADQYGTLYLLDDNLNSKDAIPCYTVPELIDLLPPMNIVAFLYLCFRTRLKPDAVADYVMSKL